MLALHERKVELLFVTPDKREGYHERIAYRDYAISPELFLWQSQNSAGQETPAGRRYLERSACPGNSVSCGASETQVALVSGPGFAASAAPTGAGRVAQEAGRRGWGIIGA